VKGVALPPARRPPHILLLRESQFRMVRSEDWEGAQKGGTPTGEKGGRGEVRVVGTPQPQTAPLGRSRISHSSGENTRRQGKRTKDGGESRQIERILRDELVAGRQLVLCKKEFYPVLG